jgi:ribonuclease HII
MKKERRLLAPPDGRFLEAGLDEAGRGALAGPVVAAAVVWSPDVVDAEMYPELLEIRDSKKMSRAARSRARIFIEEHALAFSVSFVNNDVIDRDNILQATMHAMHAAIDGLPMAIDVALVDGSYFRPYPGVRHMCVPGGDDVHLSIAAASILAKEHRDDYMREQSRIPGQQQYAWDENMGYGTLKHREAMKLHGTTSLHRVTFGHSGDYKFVLSGMVVN